jgi:hypothetical protein
MKRVTITANLSAEDLERMSPQQIRYLAERETVLRYAIEEGLGSGKELRDALLEGRGVPERVELAMESLKPAERTMVLVELCRMMEIPIPKWLRAGAEAIERDAAEMAALERDQAKRSLQ